MRHAPVLAVGDDALAAMTFVEIAARIGTTPAGARSSYTTALKKLRRNTEALERMAELARELERHRPVDLDWFGSEDEGEDVAGGSGISQKVPVAAVRPAGEAQSGPILQRQMPDEGPSRGKRPPASDLSALSQVPAQTGTAGVKVASAVGGNG